ncbi:phage portal protein [Lichenicola cladoniae]|uniref:Phage portal protein n=1 Tax=Lichenicola cladoniae TaxID=1484109 RepID=A0A6M8HN82_9PROT|nr:phage portal protein [Lichenicola cladoniae]NPD67289.1 phage portal protein [Acetobacteraceae bacterium]QKE89792.1 phage portal protein [Lichenicola cladoniae]
MGLLSFLDNRGAPSVRVEPKVSMPAVVKADSFASGSYPSWLSAGLGALPSATGLPVTPFTALQSAAVFGCVRCIAEDWSKLPIKVQRMRPGGRGFDVLHDHYLARLLRRPNRWQVPVQFWSFVSTCLSLRGNAYIVIIRGNGGEPKALVPISPDRVSVLLSPKGWLFYHVSHPLIGEGLTLHQDDMLHLRGFSLDGYLGLSPIMACPEAVGLAMATQRHGATLFRQGAQIQGVLKAAAKLSPEGAARLANSWRETYGGVDNTAKTAVLEEGLTYEKIGMTSQESQFLEVREHQDIDICGLYRVPPHKIMRLGDAHYSNIENQNQEYIDNALLPPIRQVEELISDKLLFSEERDVIRARCDFNELLRGDRKSRVDAGVAAVNGGLQNANEWRIDEGLNPYPGGDEYRVPLNTGAASSAPAPDDPARVTAPATSPA